MKNLAFWIFVSAVSAGFVISLIVALADTERITSVDAVQARYLRMVAPVDEDHQTWKANRLQSRQDEWLVPHVRQLDDLGQEPERLVKSGNITAIIYPNRHLAVVDGEGTVIGIVKCPEDVCADGGFGESIYIGQKKTSLDIHTVLVGTKSYEDNGEEFDNEVEARRHFIARVLSRDGKVYMFNVDLRQRRVMWLGYQLRNE